MLCCLEQTDQTEGGPTLKLDLRPQEALRPHRDAKILHFADARFAFRGFADEARQADFEVGSLTGALSRGWVADQTMARASVCVVSGGRWHKAFFPGSLHCR